ncbi:MAG: hypothetical protein HRF50_15360 [Phycisphaerae bacterium]|jgi:hypothetical protein
MASKIGLEAGPTIGGQRLPRTAKRRPAEWAAVSSFRIRVDLYPGGFLLATGVFESDCGTAGCGQYAFTCR